jgi:RimJ/RimL family protein N-acetyltransferase
MLYKLGKTRYEIVRPLFRSLEESQPMCTAVLEAVYPGNVFVDAPDNPSSALLTTFLTSEAEGVWGFLAGDPANETFNRSLNDAIFNRQVIAADTPVVFLTCDPQDWGGRIDTVLLPRPPIWMPRRHYLCRQMTYDWRAVLPQGVEVQRMSEDLLRLRRLEVPDDIRATLEKWHRSASQRFQDFGFITIDETGGEPVIASWARVDFVVQGRGDIGFFTQEACRRRGLATIVVAATLEYGFTHGLTQVNWTCEAGNLGSIRVAEKLSLERLKDYMMVLLVLDERQHLQALAYFE